MPRDFLQDKARAKLADSVQGSLNQLESAAKQIVAVTLQLVAARDKLTAGVPTGEFEQADVDRLDTTTAKVSALKTAADKYLG